MFLLKLLTDCLIESNNLRTSLIYPLLSPKHASSFSAEWFLIFQFNSFTPARPRCPCSESKPSGQHYIIILQTAQCLFLGPLYRFLEYFLSPALLGSLLGWKENVSGIHSNAMIPMSFWKQLHMPPGLSSSPTFHLQTLFVTFGDKYHSILAY